MTACGMKGDISCRPDRLAAGHAAIGDQRAVDGDDLHIGRTIGNRPGGDARHLRAVLGDEAGHADAGPDGEHATSRRAGPVRRRTFAPGGHASAQLPPSALRTSASRRALLLRRQDAIVLVDGEIIGRPALAGPSKVGSMRVPLRLAMACVVPSRLPSGNRLDSKCGDLRGR